MLCMSSEGSVRPLCPVPRAQQGPSTSPWCVSCCEAAQGSGWGLKGPAAWPQFPSVHPAGCQRVRAGYTRVVAGQSRSRWGLWGAEEEEHLSPALVRKVTYGDMKPQLSHVPRDGACGTGGSPGEVPRDTLGQADSTLGAAQIPHGGRIPWGCPGWTYPGPLAEHGCCRA